MDTAVQTEGLLLGRPDLPIGRRTLIMGILNVTPDSFSDGGRFLDSGRAVEQGLILIDEGADILDIGGESTRPGSDPIPVDDECRRVIPVIEALRRQTRAAISIDTTKSAVAERALAAGADIINDISGLRFDPRLASVAVEAQAGLVLMHSRGQPKNMQQDPQYGDVMADIHRELSQSMARARESGVQDRQIIIDPGLGFAKNIQHNLTILNCLDSLQSLGCPILIGPSRKSFIGAILDLPVEERLDGTAAAVALAVYNGANIVRVHDVRPMSRVVRLVDAVKNCDRVNSHMVPDGHS